MGVWGCISRALVLAAGYRRVRELGPGVTGKKVVQKSLIQRLHNDSLLMAES